MKKINVLHIVILIFISCLNIQSVLVNTVVATINVGVTPCGMAVTPDNQYLYVANNNNYAVEYNSTGPVNADSVSVIDLSTNEVITTIVDTSFAEPYTISINPAGTKAYVSNSNSSTITIIDIATNTVTGTITGFDGPSGMAISANGQIGYVNNYGYSGGVGSGNGHTISVVNLNTNTITATINVVTLAPAALVLSPSGAYLYVVNYANGNTGTGNLKIIQTSNNTVVGTVTGLSGPFGLTLSSDGAYMYITNFGSNNFTPIGTTVTVVDTNSNSIVDTVTMGIQPSGVAITPDDKYVYISNFNSLYGGSELFNGEGTVNIIDTSDDSVLQNTIIVGQSPDYIVIPSNGLFAYVANYAANTVSVIALPTFEITAAGCKTENRFLTQVDLINKITWSASGTSLPVSYSIYRDAALTQLIGIVSADDTLEFLDHNCKSDITYTYYITGTNVAGTTSLPVSVTVTQDC